MTEPTDAVDEPDDDQRCPHGNRPPCPMCLHEQSPHLVIWNNL